MRKKLQLLLGTFLFCSVYSYGQSHENNLNIESMITKTQDENRFRDSDYFNWGSSIVKGDDGKYHLFYSRWPRSLKFTAWLTHSEIAHAVSDKPEGPYQYVETVLKGERGEHWDAITAHNPKIKKFGDKYYLYYISTHSDYPISEDDLVETARVGYGHKNWMPLRNNQRTGVAVSSSVYGPWKRVDHPIVEPAETISKLTVNPGVCQREGGDYVMVVKGDKPGDKMGKRNQAIALSPKPEGPWTIQKQAAIDYLDTEDASIWYDQELKRYFAVFHAHTFIGLIESNDGVQWKRSEHFEASPKEYTHVSGEICKPDRMERPFVYKENNEYKVLSVAIKKGNDTWIEFIPLKDS